MKQAILCFLVLISIKVAAVAQGTADDKHQLDIRVLLAGVQGPNVKASQIRETPIVQAAPAKEIAGFDFSWVIEPKAGEQELMGPFRNSGSALNTATLNRFLSDAAKGTVTRVFVDEVQYKNANGALIKTKRGAAYKVIP